MRLHATHTATVYGERKIGEDELGGDLTVSDAPLIEAPARVDWGCTDFITSTTGEFVRESPTVVMPTHGTEPNPETDDPARVAVLERIEEGNDVQLDGGEERFRIESIDPVRARGHRLERVSLSVQKHT